MTDFVRIMYTRTPRYLTTISDAVDANYIRKVELYVLMLNLAGYRVEFNKNETKHPIIEKQCKAANGISFTDLVKSFNKDLLASSLKKVYFVFDIVNIQQLTLQIPFKKLKVKKGKEKIMCNNGSLCSESKLFGYLDDMGHYLNNATNAIAYWFRNKNDKNEYIPSYCFDDYTNKNEVNTLILMLKILSERDETMFSSEMRRQIAQLNYIGEDEDKSFSDFKGEINLLLDTIRGFALPCPGCQKNYYNYLSGDYENWEKHDCDGFKDGHYTWAK